MIDLTKPIRIWTIGKGFIPGRLGPDLADGNGGFWHTIIHFNTSGEEVIQKFDNNGHIPGDKERVVLTENCL